MRRKHILFILLLMAILVISLVRIFDLEQLAGSSGYCVVTDDGSCLLVLDTTPVELLCENGGILPYLTTGDKIFVIHDEIRETWPAQTNAYFCKKIGSGTMDDIPPVVIDGLISHGWLTE